jgi:hypothetical protein
MNTNVVAIWRQSFSIKINWLLLAVVVCVGIGVTIYLAVRRRKSN